MATVLSIIPYKVFPAKSGGQKNIVLFNEQFCRHQKLVALTVQSNHPANANGYLLINSLSDGPSRYINPLYLLKVIRLARQHRATHLMLEHPYYGWLGVLAKWVTGIRLVVHSQNIESERWRTLGKWWWKVLWHYEKWTHRIADYNFFIQDDDLRYAVDHFKLDNRSCTTITYGIDFSQPPSFQEKARSKAILQERHQIEADKTIFLFNGTLDYSPNLDGVRSILNKINPVLLGSTLRYTIIICGKGLSAEMNELKDYADRNIIYAGFVDDINEYFKGADVFINPIIDGGGIKTKLVEALGMNAVAVSTINGSIGVTREDTGEKLFIVPNDDWAAFARQMISAATLPRKMVSDRFFEKFYWGNIAAKAARFINTKNGLS